MSSVLRCCLMVPVFFVFAGVAPAEKKKESAFAHIVEAHFASWDKNRDGTLSAVEVTALVKDPRITGDEAAAIAAIHAYFRGNKHATGVKKDFLLKPGAETAEERRDKQSKGAHFESHFGAFRRHIAKAPRDIFATKEAPSLEGFHQGNLGDCFLLASIAAAINADAAAVRRMFQVRSDGSCEVVFYSGHRVHTPKLTDAEIALSSSAGEQGVWLNVIEKAFGEIKLEVRHSRKPASSEMDLDIISRGGFPSEAIQVLCGTQAKTVSIRHGKGEHPPAAADVPKLQAELHAYLSQALPRKFLFCCSTASGDKGKYPPGIVTDHAYAIVGYDPRRQVVTVMNPWGNHFEPKGDAGMMHGYATKGGKFDVPLRDFIAIFESVSYQTALPPKPTKR